MRAVDQLRRPKLAQRYQLSAVHDADRLSGVLRIICRLRGTGLRPVDRSVLDTREPERSRSGQHLQPVRSDAVRRQEILLGVTKYVTERQTSVVVMVLSSRKQNELVRLFFFALKNNASSEPERRFKRRN